MSYQNLALVYDKLMEDIDYRAWADYLEEIISRYQAPGQVLLDLGCGTGTITLEMAQRGYRVIGIDNSLEMLTQAEQKLRANGVEAPLYLQDIRNLELDRPVDIVIATFDTFNYILDADELAQSFAKVYQGLSDNGLFIFDINTPYKLQGVLGDNTHTYNTEEISYIWENDYDEETKVCQMNLTFFLLDGQTGLYRRFEEFHEQRVYCIEEINGLLEDNGFTVLGVYNELTFNKPQEEDNKAFFVAKKVRT